MHIKPQLLILLTAVAAGTGLAACGSSSGPTESRASATLQPAAATESVDAAATAKRPKLKIASSNYGRILFNGRGRALYLFTADRGKTSNCSGDCATAWPPYIVKAKPAAGPGVKPGLIGTTRRSDGRLQATYAGHPIYFYQGDN
jgi:predicted lipoprotein with Yx(FWY)xxD motif